MACFQYHNYGRYINCILNVIPPGSAIIQKDAYFVKLSFVQSDREHSITDLKCVLLLAKVIVFSVEVTQILLCRETVCYSLNHFHSEQRLLLGMGSQTLNVFQYHYCDSE